MSTNKRRLKYVDSRIQGQLAVRTLLHWVTLMLVCCTVSLLLQVVLNPLATWQENFGTCGQRKDPSYLWRLHCSLFLYETLSVIPIDLWGPLLVYVEPCVNSGRASRWSRLSCVRMTIGLKWPMRSIR